jgi:hypothetical protein
MRAKRMESDPCARTYDFLKGLDTPELALEDDASDSRAGRRGFNPYDLDQRPPRRAR